jgi:WXG100 family type VII secretion target
VDEVVIPCEDLREASEAFSAASKESLAVLERLEKATADLEAKWDGASQQTFFKNYRDWRTHMRLYAGLLADIAKEILSLAERFERADG